MKGTMEEEIKKVQEILSLLDFSESEAESNISKLNSLILASIAVEALAGKGYKSADGEFNNEEMEAFIEKNCSEKEMKDITKKVTNKIITEYFQKILKNVSAEKLLKVEEVLTLG